MNYKIKTVSFFLNEDLEVSSYVAIIEIQRFLFWKYDLKVYSLDGLSWQVMNGSVQDNIAIDLSYYLQRKIENNEIPELGTYMGTDELEGNRPIDKSPVQIRDDIFDGIIDDPNFDEHGISKEQQLALQAECIDFVKQLHINIPDVEEQIHRIKLRVDRAYSDHADAYELSDEEGKNMAIAKVTLFHMILIDTYKTDL